MHNWNPSIGRLGVRTLLLLFLLPVLLWRQVDAAQLAAPAEQEIYFKTLGAEQGLPDARVWAVLEDRAGFVWIGTPLGLIRYDGYTFRLYKHDRNDPNSLSTNRATHIMEDRAGNLWLSTPRGLNRYDPRTEKFTRFLHDEADETSLSHNEINVTYEDAQGRVWVGTAEGLNLLEPETQTFIRFPHDPALTSSVSQDNIYAIEGDESGALWVGAYGGGLSKLVFQGDPQAPTITQFRHDPQNPQSLSSDLVHELFRDSTGAIWVATWDGLNKLDPRTDTIVRFQPDSVASHSVSHDQVTSIAEDDDGMIWIGTWGQGLNRLDPDTGELTHFEYDAYRPNTLSNNVVRDIHVARNGLVWIGTVGGGVNVVDLARKPFHSATESNLGISANDVRAVLQDRNGIVWIGTQGGGLNRWDRTSGTVTHYRHDPSEPTSLANDTVYSLLEDSEGVLWVGTFGGLERFDPETERFTHFAHDPSDPNSLSEDTVYSVFEDSAGNLWVGTWDGLNRFDRATETFSIIRHDPDNPNTPSSSPIPVIREEASGVLLVATTSGLNRYDPRANVWTRYEHESDDPNSLSDGEIFAIYAAPDGMIWFGGPGTGLNRLDPVTGETRVFLEEDGISNNTLYQMQADNAGNLWLATVDGLTKFDMETHATRVYDTADGLIDDAFNIFASDKGSDGELFFGTLQGLVFFYPDQIQANIEIPPLAFTDFRLAHEPVVVSENSLLPSSINTTDHLEFPYQGRVFSLEFAALDYRAPEKIRYRYMLEGFDTDWTEVDSNRRFVTYTNLDPGRYIFRVMASNADGFWSSEGRALPLTVTPPWWQFAWVRAAFILFALAAIVGGYRYRVGAIKQRNLILEQGIASRTQQLVAQNEVLQREIEERQRAQQALQISRERYDLATKAARVSVWDWDLKTQAVHIDPLLEDLLKHEDSGMAEVTLRRLLEPVDLEVEVDRAAVSSNRSSDRFRFEYSLSLPAGSARWIRLDGAVLRDVEGKASRLLGTTRDITERKHAEALLWDTNQTLIRHVQVLSTLNRIAQTITTATDLQGALAEIAETITQLFEGAGTAICLFDADFVSLTTEAQYIVLSGGEKTDPIAVTMEKSESGSANTDGIKALYASIQAGRSLAVYDPLRVPGIVESFALLRQASIGQMLLTPLAVRNNVIGVIAVGTGQSGRVYTGAEIELLETISAQIAATIENVRLLNEESRQRELAERQAHELATVLDVSHRIMSMLELEPLLGRILELIDAVVPTTGSVVLGLDGDEFVVLAHRGPDSGESVRHQRIPAFNYPDLLKHEDGTPRVIDDLWQEPALRSRLLTLYGNSQTSLIASARSWLSVPMNTDARSVGILSLGHTEPNQFTARDAYFVAAFADQAAVAVGNAHLYQQALIAAADEERNRLARELHDSVTQTLFAASLIAEALPDVWEKHPEMGRQGVQELYLLTHGASAEMRALLLELRPRALIRTPLSESLRPLCTAFTSRAKVPVKLNVSGECLLEPKLQVALYRITQEALNNAFKHAEASLVGIDLTCEPGHVALSIVDDGVGFDVGAVSPDRLGLAIMKERVENLGAALRIDSGKGMGTRIEVEWQGPTEKE